MRDRKMWTRKMRNRKMQHRKMEDQKCRVENAGLENAGPLTLTLKNKTKNVAMHRLVTSLLSNVAVVPNVPLKSAKTCTVPPQIQLKISKTLNMLESQQNTRSVARCI